MILQTLYQQCIKHGVRFFDEYHVVDVIVEDGQTRGVVAIASRTASCTSSRGGGHVRDGRLRAHVQDHVQRPHPDRRRRSRSPIGTACRCRTWSSISSTRPGSRLGILLSEAARGEGGYLRNDSGERFMERYAPKLMELAPRDMVSRAMMMEDREGRGIGGGEFVHLDLTHLGKATIDAKLPDITEFSRVYQGVEPITQPVPVTPTAHYAMGGIPTASRPGSSSTTRGRGSRACTRRRVRLCERAWRQSPGH